jgi:hypothetical protein
VALALLDAVPTLGAELFPAGTPALEPSLDVSAWQAAMDPAAAPGSPSPAPTAAAGATAPLPGRASGPDFSSALKAHADDVARQMATFNQTLTRTLARLPDPPGAGPPPLPAGLPAPPPLPFVTRTSPPVDLTQALQGVWNASSARRNEPAPAAVASLRSSLTPFQQWLAQQLEQARAGADSASGEGGRASPQSAMATHLAALAGLTAGLTAAADGYLNAALSPAEASAVFNLAANALLTVTNSLRVAVQAQFLGTYGAPLVPEPGRIQGAGEARNASQAAGNGTADGSAATREACCRYADLMVQAGIQRVQAASGALNVAAYVTAFQGAVQRMGVDLAAVATTTAPALALLATTDASALTLAGLGASVLVPAPGAVPPGGFSGSGIVLDPAGWSHADGTLASRCGTVQCHQPVTQARIGIVQENLAASVVNLVGYVLSTVAVELSLAMDPPQARPVTLPAPAPGQPMAWAGPFMAHFQAQAQEALPGTRLAPLLGAVPGPSAAEAAAFAGVGPGTADAEALPLVLQALAQAIQDQYWPSLASMDQDSILPTPNLAGMLSGLYRLSAAGLERGPAAGAASPQPDWQFYGNLTALAKYAVAATDGYRSGALDPQAATTLLRSVTDALAVLFYGWSAESSAVPVEIAALYNQGIIAPLTRARSEALGLEPPPGAGAKRCLDACGVHQRRLQATADTIAIGATQNFLAAYIEAVAGSFTSDALAVIDVVRTAAAAGNGTAAPSRTPGRRLLQDDLDLSGALGPPAPVARTALAALYLDRPPTPASPGPTPAPPLDGVCPDGACDLAWSRQLVGLSQMSKNAADLTLTAYSLNLVISGLRIAIAAEAGL